MSGGGFREAWGDLSAQLRHPHEAESFAGLACCNQRGMTMARLNAGVQLQSISGQLESMSCTTERIELCAKIGSNCALAGAPLRYPDFLDFSAWIEHTPFAFWIIDAIRPESLAELGTHQGQSYLTFAKRCLDVQPANAYAIDTWQGDEHADTTEPRSSRLSRRHHDEVQSLLAVDANDDLYEAAEQITDGNHRPASYRWPTLRGRCSVA